MLTTCTGDLYLCIIHVSWKLEENPIKNEKVIKNYVFTSIIMFVFTSIIMFVDFEIFRPQWHIAVCLWTDYYTVDNNSLPILIICPKHSKTIEIVSLRDISKKFIFEPMRIQFARVIYQFYMSWTHDSIVREGGTFWILMKIGILTRLIILNVCCKFHKNRITNKKK